jgi:hypothetical protein
VHVQDVENFDDIFYLLDVGVICWNILVHNLWFFYCFGLDHHFMWWDLKFKFVFVLWFLLVFVHIQNSLIIKIFMLIQKFVNILFCQMGVNSHNTFVHCIKSIVIMFALWNGCNLL